MFYGVILECAYGKLRPKEGPNKCFVMQRNSIFLNLLKVRTAKNALRGF